MPKLLYLEDDIPLADITARGLNRLGFHIEHFCDIASAELSLSRTCYDYALLDLKVGADNSLAFIKTIKTQNDIPIVVLSGYGSIRTAVQAMKLGAVNFLTKPSSINDIVEAFECDLELDSLTNDELKKPSLKNIEWETIQKALDDNNGNVSAAARQLNMHRRTLQRKLQKKRIEPGHL
jgi:two-component system response regulator RegA